MGRQAAAAAFRQQVLESREDTPYGLERLRRAVIGMDAVMHRQGRAVDEFQKTMLELEAAVDGIGQSLALYRTALAGIDHRRLRGKARRLAAMMTPYAS